MRAQLAAALGRVHLVVPGYGRGDGSVIGANRAQVEPNLLAELARGRRIALISATNGKTTTTRLIAAALREIGEIATNEHGANMPTGHITALANNPKALIGVLETDEKYLPQVLRETNAVVVVLMNLSRDQMDRASEINLLAKKWREALAASQARRRQRRRPAGRLGRACRARHLGGGRAAVERRLVVLPRMRAPQTDDPTRTGSAPNAASAGRTPPGRWTTPPTPSPTRKGRRTGSNCGCRVTPTVPTR